MGINTAAASKIRRIVAAFFIPASPPRQMAEFFNSIFSLSPIRDAKRQEEKIRVYK
jgi:hypothetical protein